MSIAKLQHKSNVPFEASPVRANAEAALRMLASAAAVAKERGDYAKYLNVAKGRADTVLAAVNWYLSQRDLIPENERHEVEKVVALATQASEADQTTETFKANLRSALLESGAVEMHSAAVKGDRIFVPEGEALALRLAELADQLGKAVFAEHRESWLVVSPGERPDRKLRAKRAMEAAALDPGSVATTLRVASGLARRRLEITAAQWSEPRTLAELLVDASKIAAARGLPTEGVTSRIACLIQGLENRVEIQRAAEYLWSMATADEFVNTQPDASAAASGRVWGWINTYGSPDALTLQIWEDAVSRVELKAKT